jgi:rhamnosyltransferase
LEHAFDWVWLFDADSVPEPDALEKLLAFFARLPPAKQEQVCFLGGLPLDDAGEIKEPPRTLAGAVMATVPLARSEEFTECDCLLWSGLLFRTAAVARIGLPSADYVLDIAEIEYGYRARQLGFTSYVVHSSVVHHDVGRTAGAAYRVIFSLGSLHFRLYEIAAHRCYYSVRNVIYFWLYQCKPRRLSVTVRTLVRALVFTLGFAVEPRRHRLQLAACIRGIRDGLTQHMERRY